MRWLAAGVAVGLVLAAGIPARAQEMYRWVDAQGRVHFGSEPPAGAREVEPWSPEGDRLKIESRAAGITVQPGPDRARATLPARAPTPVAGDEKIGGMSQDQWRTKAQMLEQRIQKLEADIEALEETTQAYGGWGTHRSSNGVVSRVGVRDRRPELEKALERAESELDALEEDAREKGVPPGWLR